MSLCYFFLLSFGNAQLPNGLRMHYLEEGKGPVIVLIGGMGSQTEVWNAIAPKLAKKLKVIRPDNRGVGKSGDLEGAYTVDTMAEDIGNLMKVLGHQRYHVVGISLGGFAAQSLALQEPERVITLTLIGTSPGGPAHVNAGPETITFFQNMMAMTPQERTKKGLLLSLHPDFVKNHPEEVEEKIKFSVENPTNPGVLMRQVMAAMAFDHSQKAASIKVPTLILHGLEDKVVPVENGKILHDLIPRSKLVLLKNSGHLSVTDQKKKVAKAIIKFITDQHP